MGLDEGGNSAWGRSQVQGSAWKGMREETVILLAETRYSMSFPEIRAGMES